jgi:Arc/MetJ-type ribon-helix-helix transcriptional regulator
MTIDDHHPTRYPATMKKISIYLNEADLARVRRLANQKGKSQAEVIRTAINAYEGQTAPKRQFSLLGSFEGDGSSMADIPEEELFEGFGQ